MQTHPPNPQITSINPPKSLLSLPKELMADICSQLDQETAINMLYVHRSFHQPAESRIYRDVTLSIPTYWGEPVLIRPERYGTHEYVAWAKKQAKEVEMAGRAEARRRAEELIVALSTRGLERWRYIRKLVIEPRAEANNAIIQILSLARNYVTEIEIITSRDHIYRSQWKPTRKESFWGKFSDFGSVDKYTFPDLVKVSVELEKWDCCCLPELLLQRTPNLTYVELRGGYPTDGAHETSDDDEDICDCPYQGSPDGASHISPPWEATLQEASISCKATSYLGAPPDLMESIMDAENLRRLQLRLIDAIDEDGHGCEWLSNVLHHPTLEQLEYDVPEIPFSEALKMTEGDEDHHSPLQVLIYSVPTINLASERLEKLDFSGHGFLTKLKSLGLRTGAKSSSRITNKPRFAPFDDHIRPAQSIPEFIALDVLALDSLDAIQFFPEGAESKFVQVSKWEWTGTYGIIIRTLKYGDSPELLHTRTYSRSITQKHPSPTMAEPTYATSKYPQWEDATYYEGLTVPLSVLCEMKRVHGSSKPWVGRGVDVGMKAWQVLLDWKKENHPDKTTDVAGADAEEVSRVIEVDGSEDVDV